MAGIIGTIASMPFLLVGGFLFDLVGRKATIAFLFITMGLSIIAVPLVAPSIVAFYIMRAIDQMCVSPVFVNPFVNDYVVVK